MAKFPSPLHDCIIVDPYYDGDSAIGKSAAGKIILPNSARNPMSQIGKVMSVGSGVKDYKPDDIALYMPFQALQKFYWGNDYEYLIFNESSMIGYVTLEDAQLWPRPDWILVKPIWTPREELKNGVIRLNRWHDKPEPPTHGIVLKVGDRGKEWNDTYEDEPVGLQDTIVLPPDGGYEVGFGDTVYYFLRKVNAQAIVVEG